MGRTTIGGIVVEVCQALINVLSNTYMKVILSLETIVSF